MIFDIETNGLFPEVSKVHCIVAQSLDTGEVFTFRPHQIADGLKFLSQADLLIGHNIIKYDLPVLNHLHGFEFPREKLIDTLVLSTLAYPDIKQSDMGRHKAGRLPGDLIGRYSLKAWGYRLGFLKGEYGESTDWAEFTEEMLEYCVNDVQLNRLVYLKLNEIKHVPPEALALEQHVAEIIGRQERHGFGFDTEKAHMLYAELSARREELRAELMEVFEPIEKAWMFTPKRDNKTKGWIAGKTIRRTKLIPFNPNSRDHIIWNLKKRHGWEPEEFTSAGKPKLDEGVVSGLDYPESEPLKEWFLLAKRLGQIADGKGAWLKYVDEDGVIRGAVRSNGCVSGRMSHFAPNVAQVPAVYSPYGARCRELWHPVNRGMAQVGIDASGLELRDLAHYMARYDNGAYATEILEGDIHTANQQAADLPTRDDAKTFIYALIYGAGDAKLGSITGDGAEEGRRRKRRLFSKIPALGKLKEAVASKVASHGYLRGLDGRRLVSRSEHSSLNLLLQSAGAVVMKKALCILDEDLQHLYKLTPGEDYEFLANVHDEWQIECRPDLAELIGKAGVDAIRKAGEFYNFRCPLDGEYKIGKNWKETH